MLNIMIMEVDLPKIFKQEAERRSSICHGFCIELKQVRLKRRKDYRLTVCAVQNNKGIECTVIQLDIRSKVDPVLEFYFA